LFFCSGLKEYPTIFAPSKFKKIENQPKKTPKKLPQEILKEIMSSDIDYIKLKSSIQNFYSILKNKILSFPGYKKIDFIKKMNILNIILNGIKDPEYKGDDETKYEKLYIKSLVTLPSLSPPSPMATPSPGLEKANKSRILSVDDVLSLMIKNIDSDVFILNGGSFNPPHNGHIKMFESAYNTLTEKSLPNPMVGKYYGIMVVSTRKYIMGKGLSYNEVISSSDRIKLCKLACDTYEWTDKTGKFNAGNMIIVEEADADPKALIFKKIMKIIDDSDRKPEQKTKLKKENLFYLCGSDFFINIYSGSSRYSVIYVLRKSEEAEIEKKMDEVEKYENNNYLRIEIIMPDSDEFELSSSLIRKKILNMSSPISISKLKEYQNEIMRHTGKAVYCFLSNINYLVNKNYYGIECNNLDEDLSDEIKETTDFSVEDFVDDDIDVDNSETFTDYSI
jgi:nicotinic acid mononucleotide adenylyltransferase